MPTNIMLRRFPWWKQPDLRSQSVVSVSDTDDDDDSEDHHDDHDSLFCNTQNIMTCNFLTGNY